MAIWDGFFFLVNNIFSVITYALVFRLLFTALSRNFANDLNRAIVKLTEPGLKPLRKFLPTLNRFDWAIFVAILFFHVLRLLIFYPINPVYLFIFPIFSTLQQCLNLVLFSIVILVIISWVNPTLRNPATDAMFYFSDWLLSWIKRYVPPIAGLDLSPLIAILGLQFINITFISSLAL